MFPIPGSRVASPQSQIVFRGVPITQIGTVTVVGSSSGNHSGTLRGDSDGRGASFLPFTQFAPGETVTVTTSLNIAGGSRGAFRFTVATPAGAVPYKLGISAPRVPGDVLAFHSRPDLRPVAVRVTHRSRRPLPGDIFLTPWYGPLADGPMIVDPDGGLIWFSPVPAGQRASDLRVQRYLGKPVLTWWQGLSGAGLGFGKDVIYDSSYRQIATVNGANGFPADLHEFEITAQNTALITTYQPVYWDASGVRGGKKRQIVVDSVVQEIDIPTGLLLFQWDSLDHVPVTDSYVRPPSPRTDHPFDYFHANSVDVDRDGNLIVSGRNTWTIYKIDRHTGAVIWRLGGAHSSFKLAPRTYWAFQHDVRVQAHDDLLHHAVRQRIRRVQSAQAIRSREAAPRPQAHDRDPGSPRLPLAPDAGAVRRRRRAAARPRRLRRLGSAAVHQRVQPDRTASVRRPFRRRERQLPGVPAAVARPTRSGHVPAEPRGRVEPSRARRLRELERSHGRLVVACARRQYPDGAASRGVVAPHRFRDVDRNRAVCVRRRAGAR